MKFNLVSRKYSWDVDHTYDGVDGEYGQNHDTNDDISTISGGGVPPAYAKDASVLLETAHEKKLRKRSHWVAYATMFVMTVGFSVVLSGVWPYLKILSPGIQKQSLGWVVAANPFGQMLASPVVGYIGNRLGSIRYVCYFTMTSFILGHLLYSFLPLVNNLWTNSGYHMMIVARFIVGLSSANVTLCRSYLASSTTVKERTTGIAIVSAAQSLGFVIGPAIQAVLTVSIPNETLKYRTAGWVAASLGVINFILLTPWIFQEYPIAKKESDWRLKTHPSDQKPDLLSVAGILSAYFFAMMIFIFMETLAVPLLTDQYGWENDTAVVVVALMTVMSGIFGALGIFTLRLAIQKNCDERKLYIFLGLVPVMIGTFLYMPLYTDTPIPRLNCTTVSNNLTLNVNTVLDDIIPKLTVLSFEENNDNDIYKFIPLLVETSENGTKTECSPGCPDYQTWCDHVPQIPLAQFMTANALIIFGLPTTTVLSIALFSKAVGARPQGLWMALITEVMAISRIVGPIVASYIYTELGTIVSFGTLTIAMIIGIICFSAIRNRLPHVGQ